MLGLYDILNKYFKGKQMYRKYKKLISLLYELAELGVFSTKEINSSIDSLDMI